MFKLMSKIRSRYTKKSKTHITQEDETSRLKLAQLWHISKSMCDKLKKWHSYSRIVREILKDDFNVNCKVTIYPDKVRQYDVHLKDCTALHFLYYVAKDVDAFTNLIERGADFTIKNGNGQNVLHLIIMGCHNYSIEDEMPFINSVLSAQVKSGNSTNFLDDNGISHLHGACIANHIESLKLFLENGALIDDTVSLDAPKFAGYTPLHFAAEFYRFEVVQILVERGADVNARTAKGMSPLDLLVEEKYNYRFSEEMISSNQQTVEMLLEKGAVSAVGLSSLHFACTLDDLKIAERLLDEGADIDYAVPTSSPVFRGYTALHFAAKNQVDMVKMLLERGAKIDAVNALKETPFDLCMEKYNLQGICYILSCSEKWREIRLSDGETKLLDLVAAMENLEQFQSFLREKIKDIAALILSDFVLWSGYTVLHLAVSFSREVGFDANAFQTLHDETIIKECLKEGLDVNAQNARGQTPIHIAFLQNHNDIVKLLLEHLSELDEVTNIVDEDNLSYLHIACAMNDEALVEKLLENCDPNIAYSGEKISIQLVNPGSTPLHAAAAKGSDTIAEMLLAHGADLHAKDDKGLTAIHWLIKESIWRGQPAADVMFTRLLTDLESRVLNGLELYYLHIACCTGNVETAQKLLDLGLDVNTVIECKNDWENVDFRCALSKLRDVSNFTPLQMATRSLRLNEDIVDMLLRRGADVFANESSPSLFRSTCVPLKDTELILCFFRVLWERDDMQQLMQEKLGLTKLHIACYFREEVVIRSVLNDKRDINSQIKADSEIFPGCTPLHMLMTTTIPEEWYKMPEREFTVGGMIKLLVSREADVTIANAEEDTAIHVLYKHHKAFVDSDHCQNLLFKAQQKFTVNPVNAEGVSHFHLACLWHEVEAVKNFLQHGAVEVNRPIYCFAKLNAGCTPLHLALNHAMTHSNVNWTRLSQTVDLLLKYGADVSVKDVHGDTPLHKPAVFQSPKMSILRKLESYGGDIKSKNIRGQTPIEILPDIIKENTYLSDNVKIFHKYGFKINSWNNLTREGYIAKLFNFNEGNLSENTDFVKFTKSSDVKTLDNLGRTAIHNVVSASKDGNSSEKIENYIYAIDSLIAVGIDIDHQDKSGQTALHYAAQVDNMTGVKALLVCGADVNVDDESGKSALSYALEQVNGKDIELLFQASCAFDLCLHIQKLQYLRIEISQLHQSYMEEFQPLFVDPKYAFCRDDSNTLSPEFFSQVEITETMDIGTNSLTLYDFLSETGALNLYPLLLESERNLVDHFFENIDYNELKELVGIIKLQSRKMRTRWGLIDSALSSLRTLLGFSVPGLCEEILRFLSNSDLKNLIKSTMLDEIQRDVKNIKL